MEYYYIPRPLARAQSLPFSLNSFSIQFSSVAQLCPTLCNPMECRMPGLPVHHQLPEFIQTHVHWVSDINQPSHPLSYPSSPAFNVSQHQGLFKWVSSSVAKVRWPKYWSFNISPSNEHSGLISFRMDWLGPSPCGPRGSQESSPTPQFKSISSSALSFFYSPTLTSIHDYWKNHSFDQTDLCWQSNVSAFQYAI